LFNLAEIAYPESGAGGRSYEQKAIELAEVSKYDEMILRGLLDLGIMFLKHQYFGEAQIRFDRATQIATRSNLNQNELLFERGQLLLAEGLPTESANYFSQAVVATFSDYAFTDTRGLTKTCSVWQNMIKNLDYASALRLFQRDFLRQTSYSSGSAVFID
jgi:hypothetical protein